MEPRLGSARCRRVLFLSSRRPPRRRSRKRVTAVVLAGLVVLVAAALAGVAVSERGTIPAGTTIAGVDVGGMTRDEAAAAALPVAQSRVANSIRLIGPRGEEHVTGRELGARPLLEPALDAAVDAGPGKRLLRHVGSGRPSTSRSSTGSARSEPRSSRTGSTGSSASSHGTPTS